LLLFPLQERLEREYNLDLVTTAPTVVYKTLTTDGQEMSVNSPGDLPEATKRENISEPYVRLEMVTPAEYVGNLMELANNRRGEFVEMKYLTGEACPQYVLDILFALMFQQ
jgi:GTP-binding protein LepA